MKTKQEYQEIVKYFRLKPVTEQARKCHLATRDVISYIELEDGYFDLMFLDSFRIPKPTDAEDEPDYGC